MLRYVRRAIAWLLAIHALVVLLLASFAEKLPVSAVMFVTGADWFFGLGWLTAPVFLLAAAMLGWAPAKHKHTHTLAAAGLRSSHQRWLVALLLVVAHDCLYGWVALAPVGGRSAGFNGWFAWNDQLGYLGYPLTRARNWNAPDFDVTYRFDEAGWRRTPIVGQSRGEVLVLGCSFTFGIGCEDEETWPFQCAERFWQGYQVRNRAWPSAGTAFAHRALVEQLDRGRAPRVVLYAMLQDHPRRNALRKSWADHLFGKVWLPSYGFKDGRLRYLGLVPKETAHEADGPELDQREENLAVAQLYEMHRLCSARDSDFFVVRLAERHRADQPSRVEDRARRLGVRFIDATAATPSYFTDDPHPTAAWQASTAEIVARQPELAFLSEPLTEPVQVENHRLATET